MMFFSINFFDGIECKSKIFIVSNAFEPTLLAEAGHKGRGDERKDPFLFGADIHHHTERVRVELVDNPGHFLFRFPAHDRFDDIHARYGAFPFQQSRAETVLVQQFRQAGPVLFCVHAEKLVPEGDLVLHQDTHVVSGGVSSRIGKVSNDIVGMGKYLGDDHHPDEHLEKSHDGSLFSFPFGYENDAQRTEGHIADTSEENNEGQQPGVELK